MSFTGQNYASRTHQSYSAVIWRFYSYAPKHICDLCLEHIENYLSTLNGLTHTTINAHIICLRSFGHWLEDRQVKNPFKVLKKLPQCPKQRVLSQEEYDKVLTISENHEADPLVFLGNTGLRATELLSLKASSLSPDRKFLYVIGKGGKPRVIPLNNACQQIIDRHPAMNLTKNYMSLWFLCKRLGQRAAIAEFSPHALRHYFATALMRKGISLYKISKLLGHSSVTTTEKLYIHFSSRRDLDGLTNCLDK